MTDENLRKAIELHGNKWRRISNYMWTKGDERTGNAWRKYALKHGITGKKKDGKTDKENTDKRTITYHDGVIESERTIQLSAQELQSTRSVLLAHEYNPEDWEIVHAKHSQWEQRGKDETTTLYASKITVRPKRTIDIDDVMRMLEDAKPVALPKTEEKEKGNRILELSLSDIHLGRLSWAGTAGANYDVEIGIKRVQDVISAIVARMGGERFASIVVPVGGDLLNFDSSKGQTTNGTPQDMDSRYSRVFSKTLTLICAIIEEMRKHSYRVQVINTPGNHDEDSTTMLSYAIKAWFRTCDDVEVDTTAVKRKYLTWGDCLLCLGHFAEDGRQLPYIIPTEAAEAWGRTKYREAHGGHLHKESTIDYGGFVLRRAPSIVLADEWSHGKGYGCRARHTTYIWHPNRGMEEIWIHGA